jgi:CO/xanthine dehydrogenase Mo-binding subunit
VPRVDLPDKIDGRYTYVHNVTVPGMVHGRVVRPRGQGAYGTNAPIVSVDASSIRKIPGARIVRRGNFIGVVAPTEFAAVQAAAQLQVQWEEKAILPSSGNLWKQMRAHDAAGKAPARYTTNSGNVESALASASKTVAQTYKFHYQGHMPIGPCCAVASVTPTKVTLFSNTQSIIGLVDSIATVLDRPASQVQAFFYEGASSFGPGNRYVDTALAAAIMSEAVGKPVRLQLMRWDEHGWNAHGPGQLMDLRGGVDANGKLVAYEFTLFQQPGGGRNLTDELLGEDYPQAGTVTVNAANSGQQYVVANKRLLGKAMPLYEGYFHTGALRDPAGPQTAFASEQLIDELAHAAGMDPVAFRRQNMTDNRWLTAMDAAVRLANWQPRVAASNLSSANVVEGRGIGFGRHGSAAYAAAVADIQVNRKTGKISCTALYCGQDQGLAVNPELVENQAIGAAMQGVSRALHEQVGFTRTRTNVIDWVTYPILRFVDAPRIVVDIVQRRDHPPLGTGEPMVTPIAGAIANAFFDATGVRIREAPMTPARVRAVLRAAGR